MKLSAWLVPVAAPTGRSHSARARLTVTRLEDRTVPSTVAGVVFDDADGGGTRDPGLVGWTVFIDQNRNSILDSGEVSVATAPDGSYQIDTTGLTPAQSNSTGG